MSSALGCSEVYIESPRFVARENLRWPGRVVVVQRGKVASALRNWTCKQAELVSEDGPTLLGNAGRCFARQSESPFFKETGQQPV